jgi:site-specific DNA-cytosine methylase
MENIKWAPLIPLIGGQPLGAELAFGNAPRAIYSYDGFQANDSHYVNYQQNTLGRNDIQYVTLDEDTIFPKDIQVINGTPPCAALSQLNTGKTEAAKGAGCAKNEWMYKVFEDAIDNFKVRVVVVENAPALFTTKGKTVAENLFKICEARGYSLTLYKTSTKYHGIPQARDRTFAIAWDSETAPIMNWYKRDRDDFSTYLDKISDNDLQQDIVINPKVSEEPYFSFIRHLTNEDPRKILIKNKHITAFNYVNKNGYLQQALEWFRETDNEKGIKYAEHAVKKFSEGLGIWDGSTHVFGDCMNAVIGRNMSDTIHPKHNRSLTIREALHMMGFPSDFELIGGRSKSNHIAQNVPACTAKDIHLEIAKYLRGELEMSTTNYLRQNNHKEVTENDPLGSDNRVTLEEFFV